MKNIWKKAIGLLLVIGFISLTVYKLNVNKTITEKRVHQYDSMKPIWIEVDTIGIKSIDSEKQFAGQFEPEKETKISSETSGKINRIHVEVGDIVKKGQTLVELDNVLLTLQKQAVEIQIEGLEKDVARYTVLALADAIQRIQLEKAELGLKSALVQRATIMEQIAKTYIKAPFDGVVTAKFNEVGAFAAPGIPILQITNISQLRFTLFVSENDLSLFQLLKSYPVTVDANAALDAMGKVIHVGSKANPGGSFQIQLSIPNTNSSEIKAGMFGKVLVPNNVIKSGILIPASAVLGSIEQQEVYLVEAGKVRLQKIDISRKINDQAEVTKGLKDGDILVTGGFINLYEGANVSVSSSSQGN